MTGRQKALGVTEYGYQRGIVEGEFLADFEAFKAKAATIKKGQYRGIDIVEKWCGFASYAKLADFQRFFFGLDATMHDHFIYTDTNGLDCLTVK